ncbi:winged helix-turn-helix transcriptional regulator [Natranaeroarchaeum aerophilus]|uniref:ArsR family transcriptional regulator n=1 Tax=Natranaeroarchaeum aerophilus TaxID=2917711 RepID=A0AAE3FTE0_9EURY|nr:MarR family transcriptional regulator [Natranaeroarchaeum aerophilus]MCL9814700.1 ArsR family transcriptional regulator [Natranaeroarchaeum aerophilus]
MPERPVDEGKRATLRRFAALGAASPLAGMAAGSEEEREGRSERRSAIEGYLSTTPGAHFSKIRDDLQLGTGEAQHHLRELVDSERVETRRDGDYRRYFPADRFSTFEQVALGYLRRETPRGMIIELLRDPDATGSTLATALDVSQPTVSKYAKKLEEAGLLAREDGYGVVEPETVLTLVVRYADSFGPDAQTLAADADGLIRFDP